MFKILKKGFLFLLVLILLIYLLALYMSSANLPEDERNELIEYKNGQPEGDSTLKVMTYNIGYLSGMTNNQATKREKVFFSNNLEKAKALNFLNPDVIGFQEIDFGSSRSFEINQMDSIALAGDYVSGYKSVNWDKKYVPFPYWPFSSHFGKMVSGQSVLSRYRIIKAETITLPPNSNSPAYYQAFYLDRLLQVAEIDFHGAKVVIMNIHLEAFDKETRMAQIARVKQEFEKHAEKHPVILMGDFNSEVPGRFDYKDAIDEILNTKWIASAIPFEKESTFRTYSSEKPVRMIDYIFYNRNFLRCTEYRVVSEAGQISDHLPIWAEFEFSQD